MPHITTDICVIGAGAAGLSVAAGAARMGADTVLVERGAMGGDCLNRGCVPSKALLAAAHAAHQVRNAGRFGLTVTAPETDWRAVHRHVRATIDAIAPNDSVERFQGLGVRVIRGDASFADPRRLTVNGITITARRFVIATGAVPRIPDLPGLETVPFLTSDNLFDRPLSGGPMIILGGGPVGVEMAQAIRRLGAPVTLIESRRLLAGEDDDLAAILRQRLLLDGVTLLEGVNAAAVRRNGSSIILELADGRAVQGDHLLVATGRKPMVDGLNLSAAGVRHGEKGIAVDQGLTTSNRRILAVGDVTGGPALTHAASAQASVALRRMLFRLPARYDAGLLPRAVYCQPELAAVGLTESQARQRHGDKVRILASPFADNDRALAELQAEGMVRLVVGPRNRLLGVGICGPQAGEQIAMWCLALGKRVGLGAMAGMILPYPTLAETGKRAAASHFAGMLFSQRTRRIVRFLQKFG